MKLELNQLAVDSFDTAPTEKAGGTVFEEQYGQAIGRIRRRL